MLTLGHKYSYLFILVVGFILGIYFCSLFSGCGHSTTMVPAAAGVKPDVFQKQVAAAQAVFQGKIDSLSTRAKTLSIGLQTTQSALNKAKQKNLVLQTQVYDLLDRTAAAPLDTTARIIDCDSLQVKVKELVISDQNKDSLYEDVTGNLQNQLSNKDSTLQVQQDQYQTLKASFTQSIQQQQGLQTENVALRKSVKHQKIFSTLKTISLLVVVALAAHYSSH